MLSQKEKEEKEKNTRLAKGIQLVSEYLTEKSILMDNPEESLLKINSHESNEEFMSDLEKWFSKLEIGCKLSEVLGKIKEQIEHTLRQKHLS